MEAPAGKGRVGGGEVSVWKWWRRGKWYEALPEEEEEVSLCAVCQFVFISIKKTHQTLPLVISTGWYRVRADAAKEVSVWKQRDLRGR